MAIPSINIYKAINYYPLTVDTQCRGLAKQRPSHNSKTPNTNRALVYRKDNANCRNPISKQKRERICNLIDQSGYLIPGTEEVHHLFQEIGKLGVCNKHREHYHVVAFFFKYKFVTAWKSARRNGILMHGLRWDQAWLYEMIIKIANAEAMRKREIEKAEFWAEFRTKSVAMEMHGAIVEKADAGHIEERKPVCKKRDVEIDVDPCSYGLEKLDI